MQSVSPFSQCRSRAVVAGSRSCAALALLLAGTGSVRSAAAAEHGEPRPAAELPPEDPIPPERHSYAGLLTATYVLAPLLAVAVGGGISTLTKRDEISVTGGCLMSLLPGSVHVAHGNAGQGIASFAGLVGVTLGGVVLGAIVGGSMTSATCDSDVSDGCDFAALDGIIGGALVGGVVSYVGFAIYDVSANAYYETETLAPEAATLQLWLNPVPAARAENVSGPTTSIPWSGLQLGLTLQM